MLVEHFGVVVGADHCGHISGIIYTLHVQIIMFNLSFKCAGVTDYVHTFSRKNLRFGSGTCAMSITNPVHFPEHMYSFTHTLAQTGREIHYHPDRWTWNSNDPNCRSPSPV